MRTKWALQHVSDKKNRQPAHVFGHISRGGQMSYRIISCIRRILLWGTYPHSVNSVAWVVYKACLIRARTYPSFRNHARSCRWDVASDLRWNAVPSTASTAPYRREDGRGRSGHCSSRSPWQSLFTRGDRKRTDLTAVPSARQPVAEEHFRSPPPTPWWYRLPANPRQSLISRVRCHRSSGPRSSRFLRPVRAV